MITSFFVFILYINHNNTGVVHPFGLDVFVTVTEVPIKPDTTEL